MSLSDRDRLIHPGSESEQTLFSLPEVSGLHTNLLLRGGREQKVQKPRQKNKSQPQSASSPWQRQSRAAAHACGRRCCSNPARGLQHPPHGRQARSPRCCPSPPSCSRHREQGSERIALSSRGCLENFKHRRNSQRARCSRGQKATATPRRTRCVSSPPAAPLVGPAAGFQSRSCAPVARRSNALPNRAARPPFSRALGHALLPPWPIALLRHLTSSTHVLFAVEACRLRW